MIVRALMTQSVESTTSTATLTQAASSMRANNIGCLPVGDNNNFVGILTDRDLTTRATADGLNPTTTTVGQIMTRGVIYCQDDDTIEDVLQTMETNNIHHLPVRNRTKQLVGIVSLSDLALRGPKELYPTVSKLAFQSTTTATTSAAKSAN
jgi:CBS domain-containing protein